MGMNSIIKLVNDQAKQKNDYANLQSKYDNLQGFNQRKAAAPAGYVALDRNKYEQQADVTAPGYQGLRDVNTGKLLSDYSIDPFSGQASKKLQQEALGTGPSEWATNALNKQKFEEANARGNAGLQQQAAQSQAQSQLMTQGGLGGGARTSLARSGARDALMANQNVANQGMLNRFSINDADAKRRQDLLGTTADIERAGNQANLETLKGDISNKANFDQNRYNTQMQAWGAEKTADATRASAGGGGGCFDPQAKIAMLNGTEKAISEIVCGDEVLVGGKVLATHLFQGEFELFSYGGALLTGDHAVFEHKRWVRVRDSRKAKRTGITVYEVRNLVTKLHIIISNDCVFSDNNETDENHLDEKVSLKALNGET